jgi:general secretion pathway protein G
MKKGFTILELLVVISVLVILIGIAIPRFKGMQDAGRIAQARAELQTMQTAVESYYMNQSPRAYPATSSTIGASKFASATPQIISSTPPYDPFGASTTTEYNYVLSGSGAYYVVWSVGPNGTGASVTVGNSGAVTGKDADDICATNGSGC